MIVELETVEVVDGGRTTLTLLEIDCLSGYSCGCLLSARQVKRRHLIKHVVRVIVREHNLEDLVAKQCVWITRASRDVVLSVG